MQEVDAWSGSHPPTKTSLFRGDMMKGRLCHVRAFIRHGDLAKPRAAFSISVLAMSHKAHARAWLAQAARKHQTLKGDAAYCGNADVAVLTARCSQW